MKYKISINKPCQENWNAMSPTQQGAFCAVCKKDVVDFTKLPVSQFKNKLKNTTCGRFTTQQLEQVYDSSESSRFSRVAAAIGITALLASANTVQAQDTVPKMEQRDSETTTTKSTGLEKSSQIADTLSVKGKVVDVAGEALFGATVQLKETNIGTTTDFNGYYTLKIPQDFVFEDNVILFSSVGYETSEIRFKRPKGQVLVIDNTAVLRSSLLGMFIVSRRTFFGRLFNIFRKRENRY